MDQFLGRYRGSQIFGIERVPGEPPEAFRVEGLTERFLSFTAAQRGVDLALAGLEVPAPMPVPAPAPARNDTMSDEARAIAWWSNLTADEREAWLQRAGSSMPADAWAAFKARSL